MPIDSKNILNIVVALHCEAKPLITHFKLKKRILLATPFAIFSNETENIHLIVSGVGKIKMASAVTFISCLIGNQKNTCYLNVGIAGARDVHLGNAVLIHKIIDHNTQQAWFPFVTPIPYKTQATLFTFDLPQKEYLVPGLIDMEGAAFFQTAAQFVTQEQIQILKVISDNNCNDQIHLNEGKVSELINNQMHSIITVCDYLLNLSKREYQDDGKIQEWVQHFQNQAHFTHQELIQLREILKKWQVNFSAHPLVNFSKNNAKTIIQTLTHQLADKFNLE